ncbi:MAG: 50S ribosomal protein L30 [Holosporaceae bacterium]|jgi:large subunit ribosomal protein L30|nr:50S ribosomal protein L30 [Holosporaceae bacterium]
MTKLKAKEKYLCVTQIASSTRCERGQVLSLKGLGLGKIGKKVMREDNNCIRGLIRKVSHLVKVEDSNG